MQWAQYTAGVQYICAGWMGGWGEGKSLQVALEGLSCMQWRTTAELFWSFVCCFNKRVTSSGLVFRFIGWAAAWRMSWSCRGQTGGREIAKKVSAIVQVTDAWAWNLAMAKGMDVRQSAGDGAHKTWCLTGSGGEGSIWDSVQLSSLDVCVTLGEGENNEG